MTAVRERTRQQLDPAGSIGTRVVTSVIAVGSFILVLVMTVLNLDEVSTPVLTTLALLASAAASLTLIVGSDPERAPFSHRSFVLATSLGMLAIVLSAAGMWSTTALIRNDWSAVAMGVILIACVPYRPARELLAAGTISALLVGFITLVEYRWYATEAPVFAFILLAVTPLLAMCFAGVAYSRSIVRSLEGWQRRANAANVSLMLEVSGGIARSVQQDRVTILNRDVLPFFRDVLASGALDDQVRETARQISESIRSVMVSEADRSWLETVLEDIGADPADYKLLDPDHLASGMGPDQRKAFRAFLVALLGVSEGGSGVRISVARRGSLCALKLAATLPSSQRLPHRLTLAPYLAVLRAAFRQLEVEFTRSTLTMEFRYEPH
ncbi:hypothetical protein BH09ACT3_BH09ACT3_15810 [soil metagenome]